MNKIAFLLTVFAMLLPTVKASTARAATLASNAPLYDQDFNAESTLSDRGRLIIWRYHASSMVHTTEYFGQVETMEATVVDPVMLRQYWLNLVTRELAVVATSTSKAGNDVTRIAPGSAGYSDGIEAMKNVMLKLISLDARNATLASAVEFLKNLE